MQRQTKSSLSCPQAHLLLMPQRMNNKLHPEISTAVLQVIYLLRPISLQFLEKLGLTRKKSQNYARLSTKIYWCFL